MNLQNDRWPISGRSAALLLALAAAAMTGCAQMPDPAVRYLAFGDSTTASPANRQYWEFLRDSLGQPANSFAGQGKGGEPTADGLDRLRTLLDSGLYPNAQTLLYWQGGNDIIQFVKDHDPLLLFSPTSSNYPFDSELSTTLDTTQANIEQVINLGRQAGLTVYVATNFFLTDQTDSCKPALLGMLLPGQASLVNKYVKLLNDRIRLAAASAGATLVDVASQAATIAADPANYTNCDHLSASGNQIVAGVFQAAIQAQPGGQSAQQGQTGQQAQTGQQGQTYPW